MLPGKSRDVKIIHPASEMAKIVVESRT